MPVASHTAKIVYHLRLLLYKPIAKPWQSLIIFCRLSTREGTGTGTSGRIRISAMPAHKTFMIKKKLAKKRRQNKPIPNWIRMKTGNKIRYNAKRRHWRRTKLKF
ncbi:Ribosomal protein L39e [Cynara cardunculus var. scolymus]|uniref:Ribosomal protein L39e n=1 Tax=Cynara cardunculus var. scolymus TaxID=59895 RepID=A0A103XDA1_CYNCS|nr:Ribosomal protein L39e [Cynara cardunculus var. scolymus]